MEYIPTILKIVTFGLFMASLTILNAYINGDPCDVFCNGKANWKMISSRLVVNGIWASFLYLMFAGSFRAIRKDEIVSPKDRVKNARNK